MTSNIKTMGYFRKPTPRIVRIMSYGLHSNEVRTPTLKQPSLTAMLNFRSSCNTYTPDTCNVLIAKNKNLKYVLKEKYVMIG